MNYSFWNYIQDASKIAVHFSLLVIANLCSSCTFSEKTIPIIHIEDCQAISAKELLSHIKYTPLESPDSIRIGEINKLLVFEDRYYILDNQVTANIYCFKQNGEFLFRLDAEGTGEGEYQYLENMTIDPYRRQLEVYDRGGLKLIRYDLDGNFVEEIACPYYFEDFALINSSQYAVYGLGISNFFSLNDTNLNSLLLINRKFKTEIQQGLPYLNPLHNVFFEGRISIQEGHAWATYGFQDTIYEMTSDTLEAVFSVDFGKNSLPEALKSEIQESDSAMDRLVELLDSPYAKGIHHLLKTDHFLSFDFRTTDKHQFQGLYDLSSQRSLCINSSYVEDQFIYHSPIAVEADTFISVLFAKQLIDSLQAHPGLSLSPELLEPQHSLKFNDNPIVIRMVYKREIDHIQD